MLTATSPDETPITPPTPSHRISTDRLLAFSAVFLSLAALVVSVMQTKILRDQQRASVWPHLQMQSDMLDGEFRFHVTNNGVGPAILREVEFQSGGHSYSSLRVVFEEVVRPRLNRDSLGFGHYYAEISAGEVLASRETLDLFRVVNGPTAAEIVREEFAEDKLVVRIVYEDVYGSAWELRDGQIRAL